MQQDTEKLFIDLDSLTFTDQAQMQNMFSCCRTGFSH